MGPSVVDALSRAVERSRRTLFPFRFEKWIHLGFVAFLAQFASGVGFPSTFRLPDWFGKPSGGSGGTGGASELFEEMWSRANQALSEHLILVLVVGGVALAFSFAVGFGLLYVGCRGRFMFVESVIHDRFAVREPWQRLRAPAWELFKARLVLSIVGAVFVLGAGAAAVIVAWSDITARHFGSNALLALAIAGVGTLLLLPLALFVALLDDFVVPIMYLEGVGVWDGWRSFRTRFLAGRVVEVIVFYALKMVLAMVAAMLAVLASCVTCCIAALPYVSTVVLLPYHVLMQAFSLYFLEQMGLPVFPLQAPPNYWQPTDDRFNPPGG